MGTYPFIKCHSTLNQKWDCSDIFVSETLYQGLNGLPTNHILDISYRCSKDLLFDASDSRRNMGLQGFPIHVHYKAQRNSWFSLSVFLSTYYFIKLGYAAFLKMIRIQFIFCKNTFLPWRILKSYKLLVYYYSMTMQFKARSQSQAEIRHLIFTWQKRYLI